MKSKNQNKTTMNKAYLWWIIGTAIIILIIITAAVSISRKNQNEEAEKERYAPKPEKQVSLPTPNVSSTSNLFPKDLPFEKNVEVIDGSEASNDSGSIQASRRSFQSSKSMNENYELYKAYFENAKWTINFNSTEEQRSTIAASSGKTLAKVEVVPLSLPEKNKKSEVRIEISVQ